MTSDTLEVTGIDHIYIAVRDLGRSEAFYDPVMKLLGFKKGTSPINNERHASAPCFATTGTS